MKKHIVLAVLLVGTIGGMAWKSTGGQQQKPPLKPQNIVIIMADDLDSRQLSCYGGQNIKTPNIDQLASEGMLFDQMMCSEAMCVPTRASLFTGLYPMRSGSFQNHKQVYQDRNIKSVCQYLGANGYRVALTGKDHSTRPKKIFPFEIISGFEPNCVSASDDYQLDSVRRFITSATQPYCLFVMSINPHAPWTVGDPDEFDPDKLVLPANWIDTKVSRNLFCKYLAEVRRLDNQVGDVISLLKETGQYDNTLVIFLGEQGPQFPGGKWNAWDYGQRSSMIARLPGKIKQGTRTKAIVQYEDILPMLIDFAGGKAVDGLDGRSFLPVLYGRSDHFRDYAYGIHNNIPEGHPYAIRSIRDDQFKLILNLSAPAPYFNKHLMNPANKNSVWPSWLEKASTNGRDQFIVDRMVNRPPVELYDLHNDPNELKNLVTEPRYSQTISQYTAKLKAWMHQQKDAGKDVDINYHKR